MVRKALLTVTTAALAILAGCSGPGADVRAEAGKPAVAVETMTVTPSELDESIAVVGTLTPKVSANVQSEITSVVEEVFVSEWVKVRKGQPLARLSTRDAEATLGAAQAALEQAEVAATRAMRELERAEKLKKSGLLTQQGLDDARSAQEAAAAGVAAAKAQLRLAEANLAKTTIRAPFDGVVAYRGVNVGDRVENMGGNKPMFTVVDNRVLQLTVTVPSSLSARIKVLQPLTFTVDAIPGRRFAGEVMYINPAVDAVSRSVKVTADVPNPDDELRGGMFAEGQIVVGRRTGVLQVPRVALLTWDVEKRRGEVLVVNGDRAERRSLVLGGASGESVEVVEGLSAGETIVTRGGFNVRPGDRILITNQQGV